VPDFENAVNVNGESRTTGWPGLTEPQSLTTNRLTYILSYAVLIAGAVMVICTALISMRSYSPVWLGDQWNVPLDLAKNHGHYPLGLLWIQHNEHRIPILKILCLLDIYLFNGRNYLLFAACWITQTAQLILIYLLIKRLGNFSEVQLRSIVGFLLICLFNPHQVENFTWAFQSPFFLVFLFAAVSIGTLALFGYQRETASNLQCLVLIGLSLVAAFLSECSLASGLVIWVVLPFCAITAGLSKRIALVLLASGTIAVSLYLVGYTQPSYHTNPMEAVRRPGRVLAYVQTYFATSWDQVGPKLGLLLALVALLFVVTTWVRVLFWRFRREPVIVFSLNMAMLLVGSAFMTALGRLKFGTAQAASSRYQTPAMLFWLFTTVAILAFLNRPRPSRTFGLLMLQVAWVSFSVIETSSFAIYRDRYVALLTSGDLGGLALEAEADLPVVSNVYPAPQAAASTYSILRQLGIAKPPFSEYELVGLKLSDVFKVGRQPSCIGFIENIRILREDRGLRVKAEGWASGGPLSATRPRILLVTDTGYITGVGVTGIARPDVVSTGALPEGQMDSGWWAYGTLSNSPKALRAYEILPGHREVCLLSGEKVVPAI
jgi:hypothetical protein